MRSPDGSLDKRLVSAAAVVVIGAIMSILDITIVNIAIRDLAVEFKVQLSTIQWVSTGYMLALATVIPLSGWAADRFGTKRLYMIAIAFFVSGSMLAGLSWSAGSLIFFRVIQGIGGGMIMPTAMTILTKASGPERIGRVMSVVGIPMMLGPVLGPILGGWLVDDFGWRWIFYVNVPVGILAIVMSWRLLPKDEPAHHEKLDWLGLTLLSPGLAFFVYGLAEVSSSGGVESPFTGAALIGGAFLLVAFIWHSWRSDDPLIDVRLFTDRAIAAASSVTFIFGCAFFGVMLLVPLYLQIVHGESALSAGLMMAPQGIGAALTMPIAGKITDSIGAGKVVLVGLVLTASGLFGMSHLGSESSDLRILGNFFINGLGMGAVMMPAMSSAYQRLTHDEIARATTALNIIQRVGGSIGTAILAVVLQHQITSELSGDGGSGSALSHIGEIPAAARELLGEAFDHTFFWAFIVMMIAFLPALFIPRHKLPPPASPSQQESYT